MKIRGWELFLSSSNIGDRWRCPIDGSSRLGWISGRPGDDDAEVAQVEHASANYFRGFFMLAAYQVP